MLEKVAVRETYETMERDVSMRQCELLRTFILGKYFHPDQIKGWKLSEMKRPDRKTVLRLIQFFLNEF